MPAALAREKFLKEIWRAYPILPDDLPKDSTWSWGPVTGLKENSFHLGETTWHHRPGEKIDSLSQEMGAELPWDLLREGDVVLVGSNIKGVINELYLLSPCLKQVVPVDQEAHLWQKFLDEVYRFFCDQGFAPWRTPTLVPSAGVDAHIDFFKVQGVRTGRQYELPTSPELALKKAIQRGSGPVFEIKSCFRDDDKSPTHRPEFQMLEWYRPYARKEELWQDIQNLVLHLKEKFPFLRAPEFAPATSIRELFRASAGLDLQAQSSKEDLQDALRQWNLDFSPEDDWDDLFFRLYIEKIENQLGQKGLQMVYDFPASQGSLSRLTEEGWADRFEVYWQGVELANAYQEQCDPVLLEKRIREEVEKRKSLKRVTQTVDEEFLELMKSGFPPCAGIALGLDRLFMVMRGQSELL